MREALKPLWFIIKNVILLAVAAYPVTLLIQLLSKDQEPFSIYNRYLVSITHNHWEWILVVIAILLLTKTEDRTLHFAQMLRTRHYDLEYYRWSDTPYISPLHLYYMVAPPLALSGDPKSQALDPFYKNIVSDFRDRVFVNAKYTQFEPNPKPSLLKIIGKTLIIQWLVNTLCFIACIGGMFFILTSTTLADGWAKALLPIAVYFLIQNLHIVKAVHLTKPTNMYMCVRKYFGTEEPKIIWRELFSDRPYGEALLFAWRNDCERRQRLAYQAVGQKEPIRMEYRSPGLAPKPFPSDAIPQWAESAEILLMEETIKRVQQTMEENHKIAENSNGKIVVFPKRK